MKNSKCTKIAIQIAVFYFTLAGFCQSVHAQSEIRFRLVHDTVIVVSLMANDQGPFDFVLDTGTNSTVVDPQLGRRLSLTAADHIRLITVAREMTVDRSSIRTLSMGSANAKDVEVLVQDLSELRKVDSHIVGLLGQNFLGQFNYLIDYKRHSIRIEQGDELRSAIHGDHTPVEMNEGMMLVPSELQSKNQAKFRLLLDSGANYLTLFRTASLELEKTLPSGDWNSNTGSAENGVKTSRLKSLTIGAEQFRNITVALPVVPAGQERAEDGSLPSALFHSIYINNREKFVVFNAEDKTGF
jgi:predicted aspartyl protease